MQPLQRKAERADGAASSLPQEVEHEILRAIASIRYGSVEVVIHDSRVVQIESREKLRVDTARKLES
jgi:hypothetical protein